ncbi:MAG: nucleotidyltransferase domain-containing protein [Bacilli bacterium]|nr:nucleotidyltransferase domain-containing protein [Bacilli bacterium]
MNLLKQKRKELGLTQIQAANVCGISRRTYQTYEELSDNSQKYNDLVKKLSSASVLSLGYIKSVCKDVLSQFPEVECAYLFGSYARGEATSDSDIDILVVCPAMGMRFFAIAATLEEHLKKEVDIHTHRQMMGNEIFATEILKEGIRIYLAKR